MNAINVDALITALNTGMIAAILIGVLLIYAEIQGRK